MEGVSVLTDQQFQAMGDDEGKSYKAGARGEDLQDWMDAPAYRQGRFDAANGNVSSRWNGQATSASATMASPVDPAARDADRAQAFGELVDATMKERGCERTKAFEIAATKYPEAHHAFLRSANPGVTMADASKPETAQGDAQEAKAFEQFVGEIKQRNGCTWAKACELAAIKRPEQHKAYLRHMNPGVAVA